MDEEEHVSQPIVISDKYGNIVSNEPNRSKRKKPVIDRAKSGLLRAKSMWLGAAACLVLFTTFLTNIEKIKSFFTPPARPPTPEETLVDTVINPLPLGEFNQQSKEKLYEQLRAEEQVMSALFPGPKILKLNDTRKQAIFASAQRQTELGKKLYHLETNESKRIILKLRQILLTIQAANVISLSSNGVTDENIVLIVKLKEIFEIQFVALSHSPKPNVKLVNSHILGNSSESVEFSIRDTIRQCKQPKLIAAWEIYLEVIERHRALFASTE